QIGIVMTVNGSAEFHGLFRAGGLLAVVANERLSRLAFLNQQSDGQDFVVNDWLIIVQIAASFVRAVLDILIAAVAHEQGHADEAKGDRDQNNAAPVKIGLIVALVIARGVAVRLRHWS